MASTLHKVRIVAVPPGEAPLWVREKWVGLELPLAQKSQVAVNQRIAGVLSGPKNLFTSLLGLLTGRYRRTNGFIVPVIGALKILDDASPDTAEWWRTNAPHLCKSWRCFIFEESACQVVG